MAQAQRHDPNTGEVQQDLSQGSDPSARVSDPANYRSKLTMATIEASPERAKTEKKRVPVAKFIGIASGVKLVENPNGQNPPHFTALTGQFEATNLHNNTVWRSGVLYLPGGFHEMILDMLEEVTDDKDRSKFDRPNVQFGLQVDAVPSDNPSGYAYVAVNLLPVTKADVLSGLRQLASDGQKLLLEGPKEAA